MLLPIGDDNRDRRTTPIVNYILIIVNIVVFIFLQQSATNELFTFTYATVPAEILSGKDIYGSIPFTNPLNGEVEYIRYGQSQWPVYATLVTSMFMHGGWAHLGGNMLFLWIFGDNLEDEMGHGRYLIFYLLCGVLASLSHVFSSEYFGQNQFIPSLGASGAISGVLAGYMIQHPIRRVHVWLLFGIISLPAFVVVGLWFVFQIINGYGALGGNQAGGVAYAAHIGGFIFGLLLVKMFVRKRVILPEERKSPW
jgi:membrane associated rhomboid family serine protease